MKRVRFARRNGRRGRRRLMGSAGDVAMRAAIAETARATLPRPTKRGRSRVRSVSRSRSDSRTRSVSRTARRLKLPRRNGTLELSAMRTRKGRLRLPNLNKLRKMSLASRVLRWQRVNPMGRAAAGDTNPPGALTFINGIAEGNVTVGTYTFSAGYVLTPMYLFCLNSTNQVTLGGVPMYRLYINSDTGNPVFISTYTQNYIGTQTASTSTWQVEARNRNVTTDVQYIENKWYDIRMLFHNARGQPTQFDVKVVSFTKDWIDPLSDDPVTSHMLEDRRAFWQGYARQAMVNPILPTESQSKENENMVVFKHVKFTMEPNTTIETDQRPNVKDFRLFYNDNRVYDYQWYGAGFDKTDTDGTHTTAPGKYMETTQWQVRDNATITSVPRPKARKWLLVRCLDTTVSQIGATAVTSVGDAGLVDATTSYDNTASMDLMVRKKEYLGS